MLLTPVENEIYHTENITECIVENEETFQTVDNLVENTAENFVEKIDKENSGELTSEISVEVPDEELEMVNLSYILKNAP